MLNQLEFRQKTQNGGWGREQFTFNELNTKPRLWENETVHKVKKPTGEGGEGRSGQRRIDDLVKVVVLDDLTESRILRKRTENRVEVMSK